MMCFLLLLLPFLASAINPPRFPHQPLGNGTKLLTFNNTVQCPSFNASSRSVSWVSSTGVDGDYIYRSESGALILENVVTGNQTTFLSEDKVPRGFWDYWISSDLRKILWAVNYTKQYRHSYLADYLIQDVDSGDVEPLVTNAQGDIQYAGWSPVSSSQIAFVRNNDLYIWKSSTVFRITRNGGQDMFNGVPDWVYEEEIFMDRFTLWWAPDGEYIAYLSFNETGVEVSTVQYYKDGQDTPPYLRELKLRYPKVGTKNPTVTFNLLEISGLESTSVEVSAWEPEDLIIGEVVWLTDAHSKVVYRAFNRIQSHEKLVVVDVESTSSSVIRERDGSDGWLDNNRAVAYIGTVSGNSEFNYGRHPSSKEYYIDLSDESGWNHIYMYPVSGGSSISLTKGEWEVTSIIKIDTKRQLIYYTSTEGHSTERHLFSVSYASPYHKTALVDPEIPAVYTASFSSGAQYYILHYTGPDVPYQELFSISDPKMPLRTITSNEKLYRTLQEYNLPNITYLDIPASPGSSFNLNAMLRLPPNFNASKTYPLLLTPYGGPGFQEVTKQFQSLDFKAYVSSDPDLSYITLTVDNRGTAYRGRAFRAQVAGNLGGLEAKDQVHAANWAAENIRGVDSKHIGIWGWSYGGYLSAKVVELADPIITFAMITATVSDWRFYDSMYTERYMGLPNPDSPYYNPNYNISGVFRTAGFKSIAGSVLVQHGTGDENVHFQNMAVLIDRLMSEGVRPHKLQIQFFTDSDHAINYNGATGFLHRQLAMFLYNEREKRNEERFQWIRKKRR
ncbi:unnamed protein product [Clonostachys chloroleuca]|uniref:Probable dipeptidyl-aminopeptidase B n=1 Tax=Clonostachys chloroleuca TaxID=1926264 RepID=A0AA35VBJ8_9HYPO|nr:unnamed protein product [Clonostachys chloroleuca]